MQSLETNLIPTGAEVDDQAMANMARGKQIGAYFSPAMKVELDTTPLDLDRDAVSPFTVMDLLRHHVARADRRPDIQWT